MRALLYAFNIADRISEVSPGRLRNPVAPAAITEVMMFAASGLWTLECKWSERPFVKIVCATARKIDPPRDCASIMIDAPVGTSFLSRMVCAATLPKNCRRLTFLPFGPFIIISRLPSMLNDADVHIRVHTFVD